MDKSNIKDTVKDITKPTLELMVITRGPENVKTTNIVNKTYTDPITGKFVKGNPGGGKPKGARHFTTLFREAVKNIAEGQKESDDVLIVKKVVAKAKEGDLAATNMVIDRIDGKAPQTLEVDSNITLNEGLTVEEKEALLKLIQ